MQKASKIFLAKNKTKQKAYILSRHNQYSSNPIPSENILMHNIAAVVHHKNNLCDKLFYVLISSI
jgi:hypothetical protein